MNHDDETSDEMPSNKSAALDAAGLPRPRPVVLVPRRPPPGRPSSSVSLPELVERITRDVRGTMSDELDGRHDELRAELAGAVRIATNIGIAAIVMNVVAILAIVVAKLVWSRILPAGGVSLSVVALTALTALTTLGTMFFGAGKAGLRRPQSAR